MQNRGLSLDRRVDGRCVRWHKPPPTYVKINCDAAISTEGQAFWIGVVIRDEEGTLMGYKIERRTGCPPVRECEAEALVCALKWADELGLTRALVETDSQVTQMAMEAAWLSLVLSSREDNLCFEIPKANASMVNINILSYFIKPSCLLQQPVDQLSTSTNLQNRSQLLLFQVSKNSETDSELFHVSRMQLQGQLWLLVLPEYPSPSEQGQEMCCSRVPTISRYQFHHPLVHSPCQSTYPVQFLT
ncbi:hypothetical protein LINPERPRIM_LOCUS3133 [Linum perenne]